MLALIRHRTAIRDLSDWLVRFLDSGLRRKPVTANLHSAAGKAGAVVRDAAECAASFAREKGLGFLSTAYFANRVKWGLRDLGHCTEFADGIALDIAIAMKRAREGTGRGSGSALYARYRSSRTPANCPRGSAKGEPAAEEARADSGM